MVMVSGVGAAAQEISLEGIVVTTSKFEESAIDALSGSSSIDDEQIQEEFQPERISEVLRTIPGVTTQESARDTATSVNIRGLQDFGRVNVLIEGARQNFQRSQHGGNGVFYIEPEMIKSVDVTRGPTATVYGSGAIGGVVAFELLDADDILAAGEYAGIRSRTGYASNGEGKLASGTGAVRAGNFDILGQVNGRWSNDFEDGNGFEVDGSNDTTKSGFVKARLRPGAGQQITLTALEFNSEFVDQVLTDSGDAGPLRGTDVDNSQYTLGYTFESPTDPLIDFSAKIYKNETKVSQIRLEASSDEIITGFDPNCLAHIPPQVPKVACAITETLDVPAGATRYFMVDTEGFDVFNTSRFAFGGVKSALTYGGDAFRDTVENFDELEGGDELTPSGERTVAGAFVQNKLTLFEIVDLIGALRFDSYHLEGGDTEASGERASPKVTLGVTPLKGLTLFGTYAEGFRAPAVTETLVSGAHPSFANFNLIPNPDLRPEVAHNIEGGVNLKYDSVITTGDAFRAKFVAFQNKVDDYIDTVYVDPNGDTDPPLPNNPPYFFDDFLQYQNIAKARLEGVELEATYDAKAWFLAVAASRIRGVNEETGIGLTSAPADKIIVTAGFRALQEKLIAGARTSIVGKQDRFEESVIIPHAEAYTVVDLFAQYEVSEQATVNLNIDNVFDEDYRQHLDLDNSAGLSARVGLTMRLGAQ
jgi:hemoglobin/transferrin/lactoferrin receptor protein